MFPLLIILPSCTTVKNLPLSLMNSLELMRSCCQVHPGATSSSAWESPSPSASSPRETSPALANLSFLCQAWFSLPMSFLGGVRMGVVRLDAVLRWYLIGAKQRGKIQLSVLDVHLWILSRMLFGVHFCSQGTLLIFSFYWPRAPGPFQHISSQTGRQAGRHKHWCSIGAEPSIFHLFDNCAICNLLQVPDNTVKLDISVLYSVSSVSLEHLPIYHCPLRAIIYPIFYPSYCLAIQTLQWKLRLKQ